EVGGRGPAAELGSGCPGLAEPGAGGAGLAGAGEPEGIPAAGRAVRAPWGPEGALRVRPGISEHVRPATSGSLPPVRSNWRTEPNATERALRTRQRAGNRAMARLPQLQRWPMTANYAGIRVEFRFA